MADKNCANCKFIDESNNCLLKGNFLKGDLTQQGCGDWECSGNISNTEPVENTETV